MAKNSTPQGREDDRDKEHLLSAYMDKTLSPEDTADFEQQLAGDPFLADALDGLKQDDPVAVARSVKMLRKQLHRQVRKKGKGKYRTPIADGYLYWSIAIILVLAVAAFLVLQILRHR